MNQKFNKSNSSDDDEIDVELENNQEEDKDQIIEDLKAKLAREQEIVMSLEKKLQYLLADVENMKKRNEQDVQNKINSIVDGLMLKILSICDDFVRAKEALAKQKTNTEGLDAILKNMNLFLSEHGVTQIAALGEIFDPRLHEAISVKGDPTLDNDTITAEIRKGYILQNRVIRPSLVEISKKTKNVNSDNNG